MRGLIVVFMLASIGACSSTAEKYTSEGSIVYAISCQLQSSDSCIEKAGELCGSLGYHFVLPDGTPAPAPNSPAAATSTTMSTEKPVVNTIVRNNRDVVVPESPSAMAPATTTTTSTTTTTASSGNVFTRKFYVQCRPENAS